MRPIRIVRRPAAATLTGPLDPVLRRVYAARGIASLAELDLGLAGLLPVSSLDGIVEAVDLLLDARARGRRVLVVGDFDADGATSCALLVRGLTRLGFAEVGYLVPDRFRFGYGMTPEIVALAAERAPGLIVTVDNGMSSEAGVAVARKLGIDVLITDHHLPGATLPAANAICNPNLAGATFGSKALAGVGVAFYVLAALTRRLADCVPHGGLPSAADYLDLVALGTVADVVPLDRNNRILVSQGLKRIRAGHCVPGISALLAEGGRSAERSVAADLAFAAAPRLNAAGRLDDMSLGIECLLTDDPARARLLAAELGRLNAERRSIESRMNEEAAAIVKRMQIDDAGLPLGLCLFDEQWHPGVVGLVAARAKERLHRPVIAFAPADAGWLRGSARSVPGVHLRDALDAIAKREPGLLEKFGGHAMAAGLTLQRERLEEFRRCFAEEVCRHLEPEDAEGRVLTDGELEPAEMTLATAQTLRAAGPWGQGFAEPVFDGRFTVLDTRIVGERHLKLRVRPDGDAPVVDGIAFNFLAVDRQDLPMVAGRVQLAYRLDVNEYQGLERLQLVVEHLC
ncbi:MAG TPA: single-stranded-DNA-specific exonuclease RecJ [Steroidobacteraceae bacterium]|nr:single-stranded-DNA-specific exonuclease RecJ [Steroidobacteraceae bacterium]